MVSRFGVCRNSDRAGGRTTVAMAICGYARRGIGGRIARDPARPQCIQGDASQDRPQGCTRHRPADAARLVPPGTLQVATGTGSASTADCTQATADKEPRRRDEPTRGTARLWAEGRPDDTANLPRPDPRTGCRSYHAVNGG